MNLRKSYEEIRHTNILRENAILRQRESRRVYARKFQNEITHAMHAAQERSVWRGRLMTFYF